MNNQRLVNAIVKYRKTSFIQILNYTLVILFPVIVIGSASWVIYGNLLSRNGFLANMLHTTSWLPHWQFWRTLFQDLTRLTVGWVTPFSALVSAYITTKYYQKDNIIAAGVGVISYTLIFYHSVRDNSNVVDTRYYGAAWLIVGIIVGYFVGRIYAKWGKKIEFKNNKNAIVEMILSNSKPTIIAITIAFVLHIAFALYRQAGLDIALSQMISSQLTQRSNYLLNISLSFFNTLMVWLGFAEPMSSTSRVYSNEQLANLTYALTHKSSFGIPYPFTPSSLYQGFAIDGGVGLTLALIIALLWFKSTKNTRTIARTSLIPAIFNVGMPILYGGQVFLNPVYFLPFIFLPILNMLIGSTVIFMHLIPPLVYPVPNGTPGFLVPFIATGGNWWALLVGLLLLALDIVLYLPFIKLMKAVEDKLNEGESHEN